MSRLKIFLTVFTVLALSLSIGALVRNVYGDDIDGDPNLYEIDEGPVPAPNLKYLRTWMQTQDNLLSLSMSPAAAFDPITINFPGTTPFTISIIVSSQFASLPEGNRAMVTVEVDGSGVGVEPSTNVNVSTNFINTGATATMTWLIKDLAPGSHTFTVEVSNPSANAGWAGYRTLTMNIYK